MLRIARPLALLCAAGALVLTALGAPGCSAPPGPLDCRTEGCPDPRECVESAAGVTCDCPAGTEPDGEACVARTHCTEDACRMHGACVEDAGGVRCECEERYAGVDCELCAEGFFDDGAGGCTTDPCAAIVCEGDRVCTVAGGIAACACPAGTHEEDALCVPDTECAPTTCAGHGICEAHDGAISCACEPGWAGARCDGCDVIAGYHDDGAGGCTTDACVPSPCTEPNRGVCAIDELGSASCQCDAGYHLELEGCVADEVCGAETCGAHGTCAIVEGRARCECSAGYEGARCETCASGYHDDGAGGCTTDACLPDPCTAPGRGVCRDDAGAARCDCDPGLHEDGVGGCTADPCRPDPCVALGQACRDVGGSAECFTPVCDDGNPCTVDTVVGGACAYAPRPNGSACATSICRAGETCSAGSCGGGTAVVCDDANPCTDDRCEAPTGCVFVTDSTNVPSDGIACTIDSCSGGTAAHVASDAVCDDGAWCTGTEECAPGSGADARGCRVTAVPVSPGLDGPCSSWECDEATDRFVRRDRPEGTVCDDAIACTGADACRSGSCRGTVAGDCSLAGCTPGAPSSALSPDLGAAHVGGALVYGGSATFPSSTGSNSIGIYLLSRTTGVHHLLERVAFGSWDGAGYPIRSFDGSDDRVLDLMVLPGVYDVVYSRNAGSDFVGRTDAGDPYPFARHVIRQDLVIGPGENTLAIDLAATRVTGALVHGGAGAFPSSTGSNSIGIYLRSRTTGIHHLLERVAFGSWDGAGYPIRSFDETDDRVLDLRVLPGAYDVVYSRNAGSDFVGRSDGGDPYPFARHVLRENVVIGPGTATLAIDLAATHVTGALVHAESAAFPSSTGSNSVGIYLRSRTTGIHHLLERVAFGSWDGAAYPIRSFDETDDRTLDLRVLPGAYDVVYSRNAGSDFVGRSSGNDPYPFARHVVRENVVIGPGTATLSLDLAATHVTGALVHGGSATFPSSTGSNSIGIYLRSRTTGVHHLLERVAFGSWDGAGYPIRSFDETDDRALDLRVLPGTYDVVYSRNAGSDFVGRSSSSDPYPFARHVLREGVVIGPGTATLALDLAATHVTGALVHAGSATFPSSTGSNSIGIYLRSRTTGIHHLLERVAFGSWDGSGYPIRSFDETDDRAIDLRVLPGAYDVVYSRNAGSDFVGRSDADDPYPFARHVVRESVVIGAGTATLAIDLGAVHLTGALRYGASTTFPSSTGSNSIGIYLRSRTTGTHHLIERVAFGSWDGTAYPIRSFDENDDRAVDLRVLPGVYDVVYSRNAGSDFVGRTDEGDPYPFARHALAGCALVE